MSAQAGSSRSSKPLTYEGFQEEIRKFLKGNPQLKGGSDTIYDLVIEADNEEDRARYCKRLEEMLVGSYNRRKRSSRPKVKQSGQSEVSEMSTIVQDVVTLSSDDEDDDVQVIDFEQDDGRVILSVKRGQDGSDGGQVVTERGQGVTKGGQDDTKTEADIIEEFVLSSDSEDIELDQESNDDEVEVLCDTRTDLSSSKGQVKSTKKSKWPLVESGLVMATWREYQRRYKITQADKNPSKVSQNGSIVTSEKTSEGLVTSVTLEDDEDDTKPGINIVIIESDDDDDDDDVIEINSESAMTTLSDSDCEFQDTLDELDQESPAVSDGRPEGQQVFATTEEILALLEQEPMPASEIPSDTEDDDPLEDEEALDLALSLQEEIAGRNVAQSHSKGQNDIQSLPRGQSDRQSLPKGPAGSVLQPPEDTSSLLTPQQSPGCDLSTSQGQASPIEEEILSRLSNLLDLQINPDTPEASPALHDRLISNLSQLLNLEEPSGASQVGPESLQLTSGDPQDTVTPAAAAAPAEPDSTGGDQSDLECEAGPVQGTQYSDETEAGALINSEGFLDQCLELDEVPNPEVLQALISNEPLEGHPVTPAPETFTFVRPSSQIRAIPNRPRNKKTCRKKKHQPRPPPLGSCIPTHQIRKPLGASAKKIDAIMNPTKKSRPLKPNKKVTPSDPEILEAPGPAYSLRIRQSSSNNIGAQKPEKPPVYVPSLPKATFGPQLKPKNNFYFLTCTLLPRNGAISNCPGRTDGLELTLRNVIRPRRPEVPELDLVVTGPQETRSPNI